ncbi:MAG: hypothetical protein BGO29_05175 [Bacteroidales bacterium 36-12]|nr:MAG: hypothetical protein BGO29_05175 [Bacteroidales bacterium 36-12]
MRTNQLTILLFSLLFLLNSCEKEFKTTAKIIGYQYCSNSNNGDIREFGLLIITETNDSLLVYDKYNSDFIIQLNINKDDCKYGVFFTDFEISTITFEYRYAKTEEILSVSCGEYLVAMPSSFPINDFKQVIIY